MRTPPFAASCLALCTLLPHAFGQEPAWLPFQLLDNGDFQAGGADARDQRARLVPWWRTEGPVELLEEDGRVWLRLGPGATARQPVAAYAPLAGDVLLRGRVRGHGTPRLESADASVELYPEGVEDGEGTSFEATGISWEVDPAGPAWVPRFELVLEAAPDQGADWTDLEVLVPLPSPTAAELRADVVARIGWIVELWTERCRDRVGPRETGLYCHVLDCVTGEVLFDVPGGVIPLVEELLFALEVHEDARWRAALEGFLEDYLELCFHPATGLPCRWDCAKDARMDGAWVEVAGDLRFLLDVHERGPERFRAPALARAARIGETVLAKGVLPDGQVAAKYRAADAEVSLAVAELRRLDVPAQLARLGAVTEDPRYVQAARNALAELEYTLHWPGTWEAIDPGFDDDYGHYAHRAVTMLTAHPDQPAFRGPVESGWRYYAPLWRDALRYGGAVAADQVRCWELLTEYARLEPAVLPALRELVPMAVAAHFKGEQYANGAWGDVTHVRWEPKSNLSVGDLPGTPSNLLWGLALASDPLLQPDRARLRAMFSAVLRSTDEHYRRPYGYLVTQRELQRANRGGGELRLLAGLVGMLRRLDG